MIENHTFPRGVPARLGPAWRRRRRQGSTYLLVLGVASVLTVIGLGVLAVTRVNNRAASQSQDWSDAQSLAFSAVEHALASINNTSNWRTVYNGQTVQKPLGRGSFTWRLADDEDGSLTDNGTDSFSIYATGTVGTATYSVRTNATLDLAPLPALGTALCAGGNITVHSGTTTTLKDGCLYANGTLYFSSYHHGHDRPGVDGNVQARSVSGSGTVTGTTTTNIQPLAMPDSNVFTMYRNLGTPITVGTMMYNVSLSPTSNPLGSTNADGVYYINTRGRNLTLMSCNITGTLVVNCAPGRLTLGPGVNLVNYRGNYPCLIVKGDASMTFSSEASRPWRHSRRGGGLHIHRRYWGWWHHWGSYTTTGQVIGLVHVKGDLTVSNGAGVEGCVICEGDVDISDDCEFDRDTDIWDSPPEGYTVPGTTKPRPNGWSRVTQ